MKPTYEDLKRQQDEAIERVRVTFAARTKARAKVARCRREDSLEKARIEEHVAHVAYVKASAARDLAVAAYLATGLGLEG